MRPGSCRARAARLSPSPPSPVTKRTRPLSAGPARVPWPCGRPDARRGRQGAEEGARSPVPPPRPRPSRRPRPERPRARRCRWRRPRRCTGGAWVPARVGCALVGCRPVGGGSPGPAISAARAVPAAGGRVGVLVRRLNSGCSLVMALAVCADPRCPGGRRVNANARSAGGLARPSAPSRLLAFPGKRIHPQCPPSRPGDPTRLPVRASCASPGWPRSLGEPGRDRAGVRGTRAR